LTKTYRLYTVHSLSLVPVYQ